MFEPLPPRLSRDEDGPPQRPEQMQPLLNGASISKTPPIKVPVFSGKDTENVRFWLYKLEHLFDVYRVHPRDRFGQSLFHLSGDAETFAYYLLTRNGERSISWSDF